MAGLSSAGMLYATADDLEGYTGKLLGDGVAERFLERASRRIREVTVTARYGVAGDGWTPTDTAVLNAFHDATILQAAAYISAGLGATDSSATNSGRQVQSKSLGSRSVTYMRDATADEARAALLSGSLAPEAFSVLRSAGLLGSAVSVSGGEMQYDVLARKWVSA